MPAHWFRVGYAGNALVRCAAEADVALERLTVCSTVALLELFVDGYRAQHVEAADDILRWTWSTDAAAGRFLVTATRTVTRHDDGRSDAVTLQLVLRGSATRRDLGDGELAGTPAEFRASRVFAPTADAAPLAVLRDGIRVP